MSVVDLTEEVLGGQYEGGPRGEGKDEPCVECGGHFESWAYRTIVYRCHRGADGRLLCAQPWFSGRMAREPQEDPVQRAMDEVAAAAHGGSV